MKSKYKDVYKESVAWNFYDDDDDDEDGDRDIGIQKTLS